jgi:UDP-N-acetylglucosamine 2-epimerase (non-hydrolysing)
MKIMTVVGTRPEIIRLSETIKRLDMDFEHILVHTGQNHDYALSQTFFEDLELRAPDYFLAAAGVSAIETIANILKKIDPLFAKINPDAFLVLGDTNSCLASIAAKRHKVPVFHLEAGNRCFDERVPEEINRKIIDHLADVNLAYSDISREHLLLEGLPPNRIVKVGSPIREVIEANRVKWQASLILEKLKIKPRDYILASFHREENVENPKIIQVLIDALESLSILYGKTILVSTHPRTRNKIQGYVQNVSDRIRFEAPFSYSDYIHLQVNSFVVISDSGTITEESAVLGFPAINIRSSQERPEGIEEGSVILSGLDKKCILNSVRITLSHKELEGSYEPVQDYTTLNFSNKVARIIQSYTPYINEFVWHKHNF